jgi:hypothetical protein
VTGLAFASIFGLDLTSVRGRNPELRASSISYQIFSGRVHEILISWSSFPDRGRLQRIPVFAIMPAELVENLSLVYS